MCSKQCTLFSFHAEPSSGKLKGTRFENIANFVWKIRMSNHPLQRIDYFVDKNAVPSSSSFKLKGCLKIPVKYCLNFRTWFLIFFTFLNVKQFGSSFFAAREKTYFAQTHFHLILSPIPLLSSLFILPYLFKKASFSFKLSPFLTNITNFTTN